MGKSILVILVLAVVLNNIYSQNVGVSEEIFVPQSPLHVFRNLDNNMLQLSKSTAANTGLIFSVSGNSWTMRNWQNGELQLRTANGFISYYTNDLERMRILNNGNVGIGTIAPTHRLTVVGSDNTFRIAGTGANAVGGLVVFGESGSFVYLSENQEDVLRIHTENHSVFTSTVSDTSGIIALGTEIFTPKSLLHVYDHANGNFLQLSKQLFTNRGLIFFVNDQDWTIRNFEAGSLVFQTGTNTTSANIKFIVNQSERLVIAADGKVGIGSGLPGAMLNTVGSVRLQNLSPYNSEQTMLMIDNNGFLKTKLFDPILFSGFTEADSLANLRSGNVATMNDLIGTMNVVDFRIFTNNAEKVRVKTNGNIGIGTQSPSHRLDVIFDGTDKVARIRNLADVANANGILIYTERNQTDSYILNLEGGSLSRMYVRSDGQIGIGTTNPQKQFHVVGTTRISSVASLNGAVIVSDEHGDLSALALPGDVNQVLYGNKVWNNAPLTAWGLSGNSYANGEYIGTANTEAFIIKTNNNERVRIGSSGYFGIGDINPAALFTVGLGSLFRVETNGYVRTINGTQNHPAYSFHASNGTGMMQPMDDNIAFTSGVSGEKFRITSQGNIGIGVQVPSQTVDVSGNMKTSGSVMPAGFSGLSGQMLISRGNNAVPVWDSVRVVKASSQGITLVSSNTPVLIGGLAKSFSLSNESLVIISTFGSVESTGGINTYSSGLFEVYLNSIAVQELTSEVDIVCNSNYHSIVKPWSMRHTMLLPAGNYNLEVRARKLSGENFRAGSNMSSGAYDNGIYEGWLVVTIIPQ